MAPTRLANLALIGIISAGLVGCGGEQPVSPEDAAREEAKASKLKRIEKRKVSGVDDEAAPPPPDQGGPDKIEYADVHSCAGLNSCKGLGGCAVSEDAVVFLAGQRGISVKEAGEAHSCAGLNQCKGLGGCKVSEERFSSLKAALSPNEDEATQ